MSGRSNLKLTEKVIEDIAVALRAGNYVDDAAQFAGVPRSSLYRWLGKGDAAIDKAESGETLTRNEQLYADLVDAVE